MESGWHPGGSGRHTSVWAKPDILPRAMVGSLRCRWKPGPVPLRMLNLNSSSITGDWCTITYVMKEHSPCTSEAHARLKIYFKSR
eukprot:1670568-Pyramimonas_sp.AAC.2